MCRRGGSSLVLTPLIDALPGQKRRHQPKGRAQVPTGPSPVDSRPATDGRWSGRPAACGRPDCRWKQNRWRRLRPTAGRDRLAKIRVPRALTRCSRSARSSPAPERRCVRRSTTRSSRSGCLCCPSVAVSPRMRLVFRPERRQAASSRRSQCRPFGHLPPRNSRIALFTASTCCQWAKWLALSISSNWAPGMSSAIRSVCRRSIASS